jgi:hypothetical protein
VRDGADAHVRQVPLGLEEVVDGHDLLRHLLR